MDRDVIRQKVREELVKHYVAMSTYHGDDDWVNFDQDRTAECMMAVFALLRKHKGDEGRLLALERIDELMFSTAERHADIVMENRGAELVAEWGKDDADD